MKRLLLYLIMFPYGKAIRQVGDLSGIGEIITDDLSVAERLIVPLRYLFHRNILQ